MKLIQANMAFETRIDQWVLSELAAGPKSWSALLLALPSVYPETVFDSVKRLELLEMVSFPPSQPAAATELPFALRLWATGKIPTPHVLDSTWWFGDAALQVLLDEVEGLSSPNSNVLLLGAPTFWHYARANGSKLRFRLLDRQHFAEPSEFTSTDLLLEHPKIGEMDLVIMDPPWYPFDMQVFLSAALRNLKPRAKILLSAPPIGTRPGVEEEWQKLLQWGSRVGLHLADYKNGILPYVSPLFERNALRAAGVVSYPEQWRRGDLATIELTDASENVVTPAPATKEVAWREATSSDMRIRWRHSEEIDWQSPLLKEVVPGDVLPSVSRRDPRLASVAVWTSGNRVFGCEGTRILGIITQAVISGGCAESDVQRFLKIPLEERQTEEIERTVVGIKDLIAIEQREITDWGTRQNDGVVKLLT
jgi:hypothetical protein